jgi:hypothetical protein
MIEAHSMSLDYLEVEGPLSILHDGQCVGYDPQVALWTHLVVAVGTPKRSPRDIDSRCWLALPSGSRRSPGYHRGNRAFVGPYGGTRVLRRFRIRRARFLREVRRGHRSLLGVSRFCNFSLSRGLQLTRRNRHHRHAREQKMIHCSPSFFLCLLGAEPFLTL